ncbi:MAG: peptidoglycan bridge formation glycyltransferase FemA/FemB family protein [Patescibacteria group bacterium]|nr:peptidoglycan bridge formation glycyltransferase FemA/FemB family protein [Patescibacteria group bacterium]
MKIIEIDEKYHDLWNEVAAKSSGSFLQSYEWGEFKKSCGHQIWRIAVTETQLRGSDFTSSFKILAIAFVVKEKVPYLGNYLYVPHGPVFDTVKKEKAFELLQRKITEIAKKEQAMFVRFEPKINLDFADNLIHYKASIQALYTLRVDLSANTETLLAGFKKDTRYSIRQAEKKGVKIVKGESRDVAKFYELLKLTSERANFEIYNLEYYQKLFDILNKNNLIELYLAKFNNKIIGGAMAIFFGAEATYSHSAADPNLRNLAVAYPILWSIIKEAKMRDFSKVDLWGVAPENEINHEWAGFTHFKRGFAPKESIRAYPGSYFIINNALKFRLYLWQKMLRGKKI